ncbi:MAG: helix-turn-helix domain-containing protein [Candidatus Coproplasma sp.]
MKLKELRNNHKLTLKQLSAAVGLSPQVLSRYELGQTQPDFTTLIKLADFFGVTVDYLLGREEQGQGGAAGFAMTKRAELTSEEDELLYYFRALSPYLKQNLLTAAQTMATGSGVKPLHKKA